MELTRCFSISPFDLAAFRAIIIFAVHEKPIDSIITRQTIALNHRDKSHRNLGIFGARYLESFFFLSFFVYNRIAACVGELIFNSSLNSPEIGAGELNKRPRNDGA